MRRFSLRWVGLVLALAACGGLALADNSKISPDLQPALSNPANTVHVIVQFKSGTTGGLLGTVLNLVGAVTNKVFSVIPAVSAVMQASDVVANSNRPDVAYISLDRQLNATLDYTTATVNAPLAWTSGLDGAGIGIAGLAWGRGSVIRASAWP